MLEHSAHVLFTGGKQEANFSMIGSIVNIFMAAQQVDLLYPFLTMQYSAVDFLSMRVLTEHKLGPPLSLPSCMTAPLSRQLFSRQNQS